MWASILHQDSRQAIVWRPEASSVRSWREATIFLGRNSSPFRVRLHSARSEGQKGDVAIDQLEFLDCALPCEPLMHHLSIINFHKLLQIRVETTEVRISSLICFYAFLSNSAPSWNQLLSRDGDVSQWGLRGAAACL